MVNVFVILLGAASSIALIAPSLAAPTPNLPRIEALSAHNDKIIASHHEYQPRNIRNQPYPYCYRRRELSAPSDGIRARDGFSADPELLAVRNRLVGKLAGTLIRGVKAVFKKVSQSGTLREMATQSGQLIFDAVTQRLVNKISGVKGQMAQQYRRDYYRYEDVHARYMELDELD